MPAELLELQNSDGTITVRIDGNQVTIAAGIPGTSAVIALMSPDEAGQRRITIKADGKIHAGGSRAAGLFSAYHPEAPHGDAGGATARLDAATGLLELSRFDSGAGGTSTIRLTGQQASARIGATASAGSAELVDGEGDTRVELQAEDARIVLRGPVEGDPGTITTDPTRGPMTVELNGQTATIRTGIQDRPGTILVTDSAGREVIELAGATAEVSIGANGHFGLLTMKNRDGGNRITLNGQSGRVTGESGRFRDVLTIDAGGQTTMQLDGNDATFRAGTNNQAGRIELRASSGQDTIVLNGATGNAALGGEGEAGALFVKAANGTDAIVLNGETAALALGRSGDAGNLFLKNDEAADTIVFNGATAAAALGRSGRPGDLFVKNEAGENAIHLRGAAGEIRLGASGTAGDMILEDDDGNNTIHLNGQTGDIVLMNADCAEEFDIDNLHPADPGTVMAIEEDGKLRPSRQAYDKRVAGVISGAGPHRPGILLNRTEAVESRAPVALIGRVMCKVDAAYGAIETGDLLTTSSTPGHAMKACDFALSPGSIMGKALQSWREGCGMIPILVVLQ